MTPLRVLASRLLGWLTGRAHDGELDGEMQAHLDLLTDDYLRSGLSEEDARAAARRAFGGVLQVREAHRDERTWLFASHLSRDIWLAIRRAGREPRLVAVIAITIGLGVGANAAMLDAAARILFRPLPVARPSEVVSLYNVDRETGKYLETLYADFEDYRQRLPSLRGLALYLRTSFGWVEDDQLRIVSGEFVTPNYFSLLEVTPLVGTSFDRQRQARLADGGDDCRRHLAYSPRRRPRRDRPRRQPERPILHDRRRRSADVRRLQPQLGQGAGSVGAPRGSGTDPARASTGADLLEPRHAPRRHARPGAARNVRRAAPGPGGRRGGESRRRVTQDERSPRRGHVSRRAREVLSGLSRCGFAVAGRVRHRDRIRVSSGGLQPADDRLAARAPAAARAGRAPVARRVTGPHRSATPRRGRRVRAAGIRARAAGGIRRSARREPVSGHVRHAVVPRPLDDVAHGRYRARELAGHGRTAGAAGSPAASREPGVATDARRSDDEPVATRLAADAASRRFSSSCRRSSSQGRASSSAAFLPAEAPTSGSTASTCSLSSSRGARATNRRTALPPSSRPPDSVEALSIVRSTSVSSSGPLEGLRSAILVGLPSGGPPVLDASQLRVGPRFFDTRGLAIARGRALGAEDLANASHVGVVSENLARRLWPDREAVGQTLLVAWGKATPERVQVVGVAPAVRFANPWDDQLLVYRLNDTHSGPTPALLVRTAGPAAQRGGRRPPRADHLAGRSAPTIAGDRRRAAGLGPSARGGGGILPRGHGRPGRDRRRHRPPPHARVHRGRAAA